MNPLLAGLIEIWELVAGGLTLLLAVIASGHVVLYKRDSRAAVAWAGLIWLVPVIGAALYAMFGINRIRRRAALQRGGRVSTITAEFPRFGAPDSPGLLTAGLARFAPLARLVDQVTSRALTAGNSVTPLVNGDAAYPAMLGAIAAAERSVALSTYIFDRDRAGREFVEALARAAARGVEVRVLVDDVGARYSFPPIVHALRSHGIRVARFGRTLFPWRLPYTNLRNHRKLLIVDGRTGFTGGMNIRDGHVLAHAGRQATQDLQFLVTGPVVGHLTQTFADDWLFTTGERLSGDAWFATLPVTGPVLARGIVDGPDEDFEKAYLVRLGAIACAQASIRVVTPYFIPDSRLISALTVAALRGVRVDILLPRVNNLALVHWAATAQLWQVLQRGCQVWYTPPPFDHTKLFLVDDGWALIGSSNWDARSLRLNFEFDLECYDETFARGMAAMVQGKLGGATEVTLASLNARSLPVKLRDGVARLAAPYL
ncbi:MAG TPA: phospholipase D-like domain-containing protein [Gemmatimonadales bacterium]|nr:phospholipase D-like domain-containing protein [Gemmatimonadales bacterium]